MSTKEDDIIAENVQERADEILAERGTVMLFNLPDNRGIKIYANCSDGSKYLVFGHIEGMYSYCITEKNNIVHLGASTVLRKYKDGYKIHVQYKIPLEVPSTEDQELMRAEKIQKEMRKLTTEQLKVQEQNYIEMVSEQLDEEHVRFLRSLLDIRDERIIRERIYYGMSA